MKTIKFYLVLLFTACTLLVNAQTPEGYPANYARGPRFAYNKIMQKVV